MSSQSNALRTTGEEALKTILFFQMGTGALANVTLLFRNFSPVLHGHKQRPPHMILTHVAVANLLDFLSAGIPYMEATFVLRKRLSSLGCKFVYYIHRVARSTTMCSTCILSTCRFLTLIPGRMVWTMLRGQAPKVIHPSCCICWMFSIFMNTYVPMSVTGAQDVGNSTDTRGKWFCSSVHPSASTVILWVATEAVFIGLMVWSSGSMVPLLHRYHQRVPCVHSPNSFHKHPLETRAAHTIVWLVATFVSFYVNSVVTFYLTAFVDFRLWLIQTSSILALCFLAFSPFLLILRNPGPPRSCS
ncbi:LOW QUALITY PROTEIN: vomeronasal type-1 receptor 3-like [Leptonychotes weddellii]|uniref:Vomeronasal type-1 receptor n=1 Tax=Leptonychotes weddellii TaxID=9713 RepID=A0A7F8Q163_LEPWE|nr:LOW QUALITY PROTEIN: vomeronasal type-1 receptor 3-like [Leptonychotes weddellii]